jgi:myo-inositol-1-phosphate synthase
VSRGKIRLAIIGVGNCASSLVQGLEFYRNAAANDDVPGLMNVELGGYRIRDIEIAAAFDVSAGKVGCDVSEAIDAAPNNTIRFAAVPPIGVRVHRGPTLDGLGRSLREVVRESDAPVDDVTGVLRDTGADVAVCYLPVGSEQATEWYAERVLEAGCGFVNCIPVFIGSNGAWRRRFEERRLPLIGDDIKSQVGATIVHRLLANLFRERGIRLDHTYQLNFGGNGDFRNMLERERVASKKISKTNAVLSQLSGPMAPEDIHIGPCDFVPWLADRKVAMIRMEGTAFGNVPLSCELKLEVWDSPNSAGVVIDAVRCVKIALDRGVGGALIGPSAYFMKSPPQQFTDAQARLETLRFVEGAA